MKKIPFLLRHNLHTVKCTDLKCYSSMNLYIYINVDSQHLDGEVELSSTPEGSLWPSPHQQFLLLPQE